MRNSFAVVIPNWNGADMIGHCVSRVQAQTQSCTVIVVDNGSTDGSLSLLRPMAEAGEIVLIERNRNYGFTGGVNPGLEYAIGNNFDAAALLNNDALADEDWLKHLVSRLQSDKKIGIVTSKILDSSGEHFDSTGNNLSIWGLAYGRGRHEPASTIYDNQTRVLAASGGACLLRVSMLKKIGLFDQDFFAYYEDVDISLRARLAGWEIYYEPKSRVHHAINATGGRNKAFFFTYQSFKNMPWVIIKNIPGGLFWRIMPRFLLAYSLFFVSALISGKGWSALKGAAVSLWHLPKKLGERSKIQSARKITAKQLDALITHDLPSDATKLQKLRGLWWRVRGKA